ncbi:MAG TPA: glycosyltransferase, partial [Halococcus sp.]|nr:glycosyltransferase [Halococcus sp.]
LASGEYVAFLDEDDLFTPESIERRVRALDGGCDVVYGDWYEVGPDFGVSDVTSEAVRRRSPPIENQARQHVHQFVAQGLRPSAVMVRKECFERHWFNPSLRMAEDFHLWVRLAHDFRVCRVDRPVLYYRRRPGTLSRTDRNTYRKQKLAAISDLERRYPELRAHADPLRAREWYLHGREKLAAGETHTARSASMKALKIDPQPRNVALLATLCLPLPVASKNRFFGGLERIQGTAHRFVNAMR